MNGRSAFDALRSPPESRPTDTVRFSPHPAFEQYLRIHKVLVGASTAKTLERIHAELADQSLPRYLGAAGWAAAEAALAQPQAPTTHRNNLLAAAGNCWERALESQLTYNAREGHPLAEHSAPYRTALDLAHLPLLQAMVSGNVTPSIQTSVARDVLNIAEANIVQLNLAMQAGDLSAVSDHSGVGHEANALLAFHSFDSPGLLAIPSSSRGGSGHYHREQTHDLLVIRQKWGTVLDMTPAEIKSSASNNDRKRYKSLLIRGKIHLSVVGKYAPEYTLAAFSAYFNGSQTTEERRITDHARRTVMDLYWLYKRGRLLGEVATSRSPHQYRDPTHVRDAYPELAPSK